METLLYLQPIHIDYVNKVMLNLTPGKKNKFMSRILEKKQKQKKKKKTNKQGFELFFMWRNIGIRVTGVCKMIA